jgi:chromate reductase
MVRLLSVCGSLQARSANRAALDVVSAVAAARGATVDDFTRVGALPAFDPEPAGDALASVDEWRRRVDDADVVIVAAPEYAGGVAGVAKNAFDWLVGSGNLYRKPMAVISAGTSGGTYARHDLAQTLTWQGAYVIGALGISAPRTKSDAAGRLVDVPTLAALASLTEALLHAAHMSGPELVDAAAELVRSLGIDVAHVAPAA